jgi:hypothetical protein
LAIKEPFQLEVNYMKKLLLTLIAACPLYAQTTNVSLVVTVVEPTRTNSFNMTLSKREVVGLSLNYAKDVMVATQNTNTPPTFRLSVRDTINGLLTPLAVQAAEHVKKEENIAEMLAFLEELIASGSITNSHKQAIIDIYNIYKP